MLDHATSEIASGNKLDIDATKKLPGEDLKRPGPLLIMMDGRIDEKIAALLGGRSSRRD